jgi:putative proteasome-type protease
VPGVVRTKIDMTYCLGIITKFGIVMASDSRTNAGVDYVSNYQKLFDFSLPEERVIVICTAGNLSITQSVIACLQKNLKAQETINLHTLPTLYEVASYVGTTLREIQQKDANWLQKDGIDYKCSFLVGGQIRGEEPQIYLIYNQGNFIHATPETPFLQLGETKYGKPILDRTLKYDTPLESAAKCALLSIDSTMKSNISVGPPISIIMYENDTFTIKHQLQLPPGDPYLLKIRKLWEESLRKAFDNMPDVEWKYYLEKDTEAVAAD